MRLRYWDESVPGSPARYIEHAQTCARARNGHQTFVVEHWERFEREAFQLRERRRNNVEGLSRELRTIANVEYLQRLEPAHFGSKIALHDVGPPGEAQRAEGLDGVIER